MDRVETFIYKNKDKKYYFDWHFINIISALGNKFVINNTGLNYGNLQAIRKGIGQKQIIRDKINDFLEFLPEDLFEYLYAIGKESDPREVVKMGIIFKKKYNCLEYAGYFNGEI